MYFTIRDPAVNSLHLVISGRGERESIKLGDGYVIK